MFALTVSFAAALIVSLIVTYGVRGWAVRRGLVDVPDGARRLHDQPVPRVGGIAVYASAMLVLAAVARWGGAGVPEAGGGLPLPIPVVVGGAAMFALGFWDDVRQLKARTKLIGQILIAAAVFAMGIRIENLGLLGSEPLPVWLSFCATVFWLVGITNAFNLIDGSDGVAGGSAIFAALAVAVTLLLAGDRWGAFVALTLAGATLGFLFYNFPPASIFLGDCGSLFLGFTLGALGVVTSQEAPTVLAVAIPVVSFGLPILDTTLAIVRRFLRRQPLFKPDRGHIHHRLRDLGHSPRKVALLLYFASAGFALLSLLLVPPTGPVEAAIFVVAGVVVWIAVQRLDIPELLELRRILHRGLQQRRAIANNVRIREGIAAMRRATSAADVLRALDYAIPGDGFLRGELWLPESIAGALVAEPDVVPSGKGYLWRWGITADVHAPELIEVRLSLRNDHGRAVGRLSLWHPVEEPHLLADLRLIAMELLPELNRVLLRLAERPRETVIPQAQVVVEREVALVGESASSSV